MHQSRSWCEDERPWVSPTVLRAQPTADNQHSDTILHRRRRNTRRSTVIEPRHKPYRHTEPDQQASTAIRRSSHIRRHTHHLTLQLPGISKALQTRLHVPSHRQQVQRATQAQLRLFRPRTCQQRRRPRSLQRQYRAPHTRLNRLPNT